MVKKVVWRDGTFIYPQHFQQMEEFMESVARGMDESTFAYAPSFGLTELELDESPLSLGQVCIKKCAGKFPDQNFFQFSGDILLNVDARVVDEIVFLVLPISHQGKDDYRYDDLSARYVSQITSLYDESSDTSGSMEIELAEFNLQLKLESEDLTGFAKLAVAKVLEVSGDGRVSLDRSFIPQCLSIGPSSFIIERLKELSVLARAKSNQLMSRIKASEKTQQDISLYQDQQQLQLVYRTIPWLEATACSLRYPLGKLFIEIKQLEHSLASLVLEEANPWQPLKGFNLFAQLQPVFANIKRMISVSQDEAVREIPWDDSLFSDRRLLLAKIPFSKISPSTRMILGVRSSNLARVSKQFPDVSKVAGDGVIVSIVKGSQSGIDLMTLPYPPPELKFDGTSAYFQIDMTHDLWDKMVESKELLALHMDVRLQVESMSLFMIA